MNFLSELTPGKALAMIVGSLVMTAVWFMNVVTTFTYGANVIGPFLLVAQLGSTASATLSGVAAILFFDFAYTVSFITLLFACRSVWQYGIVGFQFLATLFLAVTASVVSILLLSPLGADAPSSLLSVVRYMGYGGLVVGFMVNCLCTIGYIATSPRMSEVVYESVRSASELSFMRAGVSHLDRESRNHARLQVNQAIPGLAEWKSQELLREYMAKIGRKSDGLPPGPETAVSSLQEQADEEASAVPEPERDPEPAPKPKKKDWRDWAGKRPTPRPAPVAPPISSLNGQPE